MDWADERYVKLFTRDTPDWVSWPWQARALLPLLFRKVDRAGELGLGRAGASGLAVLVGLPIDVTQMGLDALVIDGSIVLSGQSLIVRNFQCAQDTRASDKTRQRDFREKRRAKLLKEHNVGVTPRHALSQSVITNLAVPNLTEPIKKHTSASADCLAVFEHWKVTLGHPRARLDAKRTKAIQAALKHYTLEDAKAAIDGCKASEFHMGQNDSHQVYDSLALILRDAEQIDKFIAIKTNGPIKKILDVRKGHIMAEDSDWTGYQTGEIKWK